MNKSYYALTPAQDVCYLQCKFSIFKRVINILSSITFTEEIDFDLMNQAYKLLVERNDCLRIKFFKKKGKLHQYFDDYSPVKDVKVLSFETEEKQADFIDRVKMRPIKYLRGTVIEPYFVKTFDNRSMVFFKVCHLVLDVYGINVMYRDLIGIYEALKNGTELPPPPASYEEIVKKDLEKSSNQNMNEKHREYFTNLLTYNPEPFYAGIHGPNQKIWQKQRKKNARSMPVFFINNDTQTYRHKIDRETVKKVLDFCQSNQQSPANLLFYVSSLTLAMLNGNVKNMMPVGLYNCRVSAQEKNCGGTKAQSGGCYTKINYAASFEENLKAFSAEQLKLYRHVKFSDLEFESLMHGIYRSPAWEIYYSMGYSLIPFDIPDGIEFNMYTNGKGALPAYVVQFLNSKTMEIDMAYDVQVKITSEEDVRIYHSLYLNVLKQVLANPEIKVSDISLHPSPVEVDDYDLHK